MKTINGPGGARVGLFVAAFALLLAATRATSHEEKCPHVRDQQCQQEKEEQCPHARTEQKLLVAPQSLSEDHRELHEKLAAAAKLGGETGAAAQQVAEALHPHFLKEEKLAMPLLAAAKKIADQTATPAEIAEARSLGAEFKRELPEMLKEHAQIKTALRKMVEASEKEKKTGAMTVASFIENHARLEEEVLYPSALMVQMYLQIANN